MQQKLIPSDEQQKIIERVGEGYNIKTDAVAGSGKTQTVLFLAAEFPKKKILQITYNAMLKEEVRQKALILNHHNLIIHSYHALYVKFYGLAKDDMALRKMIRNNIPPRCKIPDFDIIVIDEIQDMTFLYYEALWKFLADSFQQNGKIVQICLVGDENQTIYEFKDADPRFLTMSSVIWPTSFIHEELPLQMSFRLTDPIASFINQYMLKEDRIKTSKPGPKVEYVICDPFDSEKILDLIKPDLIDGSLNPQDIFVLSGSLKSQRTPVRRLENLIVTESKRNGFGRHIPVYCTFDEERILKEDLIQNKIVFSTIHQAKGRERPVVILFGFDVSYFQYYCRTKPWERCPSELYVACSRASHRLILVHGSDNATLPFLQKEIMRYFNKVPEKRLNLLRSISEPLDSPETSGDPLLIDHALLDLLPFRVLQYKALNPRSAEPLKEEDNRKKDVTDMVRFLNLTTEARLESLLTPTLHCIIPANRLNRTDEQNQKFRIVNIQSIIYSKYNLPEEVSEINGIAIPALYEAKTTEDHDSQLFKILREWKTNPPKEIGKFIRKQLAHMSLDQIDIPTYLHAANVYQATHNQLYHKLTQIPHDYTWLSVPMIDECHSNMSHLIADGAHYEVPIRYTFFDDLNSLEIHGIIDVDDGQTIWELKCVEELRFEHFIQLALYAYIWHMTEERNAGKRTYKLFNIRTAEVWEIKAAQNWAILRQIMQILVDRVFKARPNISDQEFLAKTFEIRRKYFPNGHYH